MSTTTPPSSTSSKKRFHITPNPFESKFGYARAVRKGPFIFVSGTTALNPDTGKIEYPDDAAKQADVAFKEALKAAEALDGRREDVCRVRMFVGRAEDCEGVGEAFRKVFGRVDAEPEVGCAATMIVVPGGFVDGEMRVEVELDAVVG